VPNERIVYAYDMHLNEVRMSVFRATIEFKGEDAGTRLSLTEQGAFLDGYDDAGSRERGTRAARQARLGIAARSQRRLRNWTTCVHGSHEIAVAVKINNFI
jgi:uncharacterized protein YndB with AHSA1/START domain